jgi:pyruvate/2-oxoglutarate/acetoin dehydrogenase E1 component
LKAADRLQEESGMSAEVIDLRCLVPLDMETVLMSVQKTGRCVVVSQAVSMGSFTGEVASTIQQKAFDYLDAPVVRVGAKERHRAAIACAGGGLLSAGGGHRRGGEVNFVEAVA